MNTSFTLLLLLAALAAVFACAWHWTRSARTRRSEFCNGLNDGRRADGQRTYLADAAIATRYLLVKIGSDANHIAVCSAVTDNPIGLCTDEPAAAEDETNVAILGASPGTHIGVSGAAITAGAYVATTAAGKLQTAVATQFVIGRALTAAAGADELVEFTPIRSDRAI